MTKAAKYVYRFYENKLPSVGEVVIIKITRITDLGVYVELLEYANTEGLIVVGELSKKRFKSVSALVKIGKIEAATVIRVDFEKGYIDLSRKKVQSSEATRCLKKYGMAKIAHNVICAAAKNLKMSIEDLYENFAFEKARSKGTLYNYFLYLIDQVQEERKLGINIEENVKTDENLKSKDNFKDEIHEKENKNNIGGEINNEEKKLTDEEILKEIKRCVVNKFNVAKFKVRADIEIFCISEGGVEDVKAALSVAKDLNTKIEITLVKPPTYTVSITSPGKESSLCLISNACKLIEQEIIKKGGHFKIISYPQVYGEKGNIEMLCSKFDNLYGDFLDGEFDESSES